MAPAASENDSDTAGVGEGGTLMLSRAHRFVDGDQRSTPVRTIGTPLDQRHVKSSARHEVVGVNDFKWISRASHLGFCDELDRVGNNTTRRILVEGNPHAAFGKGASAPRVKCTACCTPAASVP